MRHFLVSWIFFPNVAYLGYGVSVIFLPFDLHWSMCACVLFCFFVAFFHTANHMLDYMICDVENCIIKPTCTYTPYFGLDKASGDAIWPFSPTCIVSCFVTLLRKSDICSIWWVLWELLLVVGKYIYVCISAHWA